MFLWIFKVFIQILPSPACCVVYSQILRISLYSLIKIQNKNVLHFLSLKKIQIEAKNVIFCNEKFEIWIPFWPVWNSRIPWYFIFNWWNKCLALFLKNQVGAKIVILCIEKFEIRIPFWPLWNSRIPWYFIFNWWRWGEASNWQVGT